MADATVEQFSWRVQGAIYAVGMFSNSNPNLTWVLIPLWLLSLDASPLEIGLAMGSRNLLPVLFSIHGGALLDRFDTRRVMLCFAVTGMLVPLLYPVLPVVWAVIVLQMIAGYCNSMGWIGAQTVIGRFMRGNPVYIGRMSFATRMGVFAGPPIIGAAWDLFGPWGGFGVLALWGGGVLAGAWMLPREDDSSPVPERPPFSILSLLPRLSDYREAFKLFAIPVVAMVITVSVLRHFGSAIQGSFYTVYLEDIGISGTVIGLLVSISGVVGSMGALLVALVMRLVASHWLLIMVVAVSLTCITITPLLETFVPLAIAGGLRGGAMAMGMVVIVSMLAAAVAPVQQGQVMGLRTTVNHLVAFVVPVIMGALVELVGLAASFYLVGGAALVVLALAALRMARTPPLIGGAE